MNEETQTPQEKKPFWSEPRRPNDECSYDHVVAQIGQFEFRVEWKSWKEFPGYGLFCTDTHCNNQVYLQEVDDAGVHAEETVRTYLGRILRDLLAAGITPAKPGE